MQPVALIVGASSGFGYLAALRMIEQGFVVYAVARRTAPMAQIEERGGHTMKMDICDPLSVQQGIQHIIDQHGQIDVVMNNAGFGVYGCIEDVSIDDARRQFDVNLFGAACVTQAVLPHMREKQRGRILFTASLASYLTTPASGWYAASKHAIKAFAEALRMETKAQGIQVIQIEPGPVKTGFEDVAFNEFDQRAANTKNPQIMAAFKGYMHDSYAKAPDANSTIEAMITAATIAKPKSVYRTTWAAKVFAPLRMLLGATLTEKVVMRLFMSYAPTSK